MEIFMQFIMHYGAIGIFIIVFLEYLNLPGFPAGIIMPLAGIWAAEGHMNFFLTIFITILAGVSGSIVLYALGRGGGELFLKKLYQKFPGKRDLIEDKIFYLKEKGVVGVFICKLIPVARTLISIPAGIIKMNFIPYVISSAFGVALWNLAFVGAGYFFGYQVLGG